MLCLCACAFLTQFMAIIPSHRVALKSVTFSTSTKLGLVSELGNSQAHLIFFHNFAYTCFKRFFKWCKCCVCVCVGGEQAMYVCLCLYGFVHANVVPTNVSATTRSPETGVTSGRVLPEMPRTKLRCPAWESTFKHWAISPRTCDF